jgi:hypothetical protein
LVCVELVDVAGAGLEDVGMGIDVLERGVLQ